jgi:hypothetical protein
MNTININPTREQTGWLATTSNQPSIVTTITGFPRTAQSPNFRNSQAFRRVIRFMNACPLILTITINSF